MLARYYVIQFLAIIANMPTNRENFDEIGSIYFACQTTKDKPSRGELKKSYYFNWTSSKLVASLEKDKDCEQFKS